MSRKTTIQGSNVLIREIDQEIRDITKSENLIDKGKGFVFWILRNYFDLGREIAAASLIDSPNDKRVDAFH